MSDAQKFEWLITACPKCHDSGFILINEQTSVFCECDVWKTENNDRRMIAYQREFGDEEKGYANSPAGGVV